MTISTDGFRIPVTLQLKASTYRAIHSAAQRASAVAGRKVDVRELIEARLDEAITGVGRPARPVRREVPVSAKRSRGNRLSAEDRDLLLAMNAAGSTAMEIATAVGCHTATVAYYRNKIRTHQPQGESNA